MPTNNVITSKQEDAADQTSSGNHCSSKNLHKSLVWVLGLNRAGNWTERLAGFSQRLPVMLGHPDCITIWL